MIRVVSAKPLSGYRLQVTFNDGVVGIFAVEPAQRGGVFNKLLDSKIFNAVTINPDFGCVEWPGGIDLDPYTMHQDLSGLRFETESHPQMVLRDEGKLKSHNNPAAIACDMSKGPKEIDDKLVKGRRYKWQDITKFIGHEPHGYLTQVGQKIICGCFRKALNPDAPDIVLPGNTELQWVAKAQLFQHQGMPVPVFIKNEGLDWEFVGQFQVKSLTQNPQEIQIQKDRYPHIQDIGAVMFLREG